RTYSSDVAPPPLLTKLKGDLKTAMRAKDTARLSVLRSVISGVNNASKTPSPVKTDVQLVALLRKTARSSQDAADEFRTAGRSDLVEKEEAQIKILNEYMQGSGIDSVGEEQMRAAVVAAIAALKAEGATVNAGQVMKRLFAPGAALHGKDVDSKRTAQIAQE
ncbi:GatB/YqeY domain-containing protein, partial [Thozetella sp. PMI_491]